MLSTKTKYLLEWERGQRATVAKHHPSVYETVGIVHIDTDLETVWGYYQWSGMPARFFQRKMRLSGHSNQFTFQYDGATYNLNNFITVGMWA